MTEIQCNLCVAANKICKNEFLRLGLQGLARIKILFIVCITTIFVGVFLYAPNYLAYSDSPKKADAIVLLIGPNFEERKKDALSLISEGFSKYLIIPGHQKILEVSHSGVSSPAKHPPAKRTDTVTRNTDRRNSRFCEGTHLEVLQTKDYIDCYSLKSVIFVSNRYHMRRIKIIAKTTLDGINLMYYSSRKQHENSDMYKWWWNSKSRKWVITEYFKIVWFLMYTHIPYL